MSGYSDLIKGGFEPWVMIDGMRKVLEDFVDQLDVLFVGDSQLSGVVPIGLVGRIPLPDRIVWCYSG